MRKIHIEERLDQMLLFIFEDQESKFHWLAKAANNVEFDEYIYALSDEYAKEK